MKKQLGLLTVPMLAGTLLFAATGHAAPAITVQLDGQTLHLPQQPLSRNYRTFVPMRALFETIGAKVDWDESTQTVTATKGDVTIRLTLGSDIAYRNDAPVVLDVTPFTVDDHTYVPVRFIAESFNNPVQWDEATQTVKMAKSNRARLEEVMAATPSALTSVHQTMAVNVHVTNGRNTSDGGYETVVDYGLQADKSIDEHVVLQTNGAYKSTMNNYELYVKGDSVYKLDEGATQWKKDLLANFPDHGKSLTDINLPKFPSAYAKFATLEETPAVDSITYHLNGETFKQLMKDLGSSDASLMQTSGLGEIVSVDLQYAVDKALHLSTSSQMTVNSKLSGYSITSKLSVRLTDINKGYTATLPAAAINAEQADLSKS